jgi:hypothetical protein
VAEGGHTKPEPVARLDPKLCLSRVDPWPGPTQTCPSSSQGREMLWLQTDDLFPLPVLQSRWGRARSQLLTHEGVICLPGGSGGTHHLWPGSCFRQMGGGLSRKGCPFPQHSGNDLWILDPREPRLLPPQLVPLWKMGQV